MNSYRWEADQYSLSNISSLQAVAVARDTSCIYVGAAGSLDVFCLEVTETADQEGALLRQAPAMRTRLDTSPLRGSAGNSQLEIHSLSCCSTGQMLAVIFQCDGRVLPEVAVYLTSVKHGRLVVTFLKTISCVGSKLLLDNADEGLSAAAEGVLPVHVAVGVLGPKKNAVYTLWSDSTLTYHLM